MACGSAAHSSPTAHPHRSAPRSTSSASPVFTPPPGNSPAPTAGGTGTYSVTVSVAGTDTVHGSFTQPANPGGTRCPPPGELSGTVSGQHVELQLTGAPAPVSQQALSPGDVLLTVGGHTWAVASSANAPHGTSGSLQRNDDGSGTVQFQNLALQTNFAQQPQDSGSISWTCA